MEDLFKIIIKQIGLYHLGACISYLWNKLLGRKKTYKEIIDSEDYLDGVFLYWLGLLLATAFIILIVYLSDNRII